MKINLRAILIVLCLTLLPVLLGMQVKMAAAQSSNPAQSTPITPPITFTYTLSGRIALRFLNIFVLAPVVRVEAKNLQTGEVFSDRTNPFGFYSITVNQASRSASYIVKPNDVRGITWETPYYQLDRVFDNISNLNFVGKRSQSASSGTTD